MHEFLYKAHRRPFASCHMNQSVERCVVYSKPATSVTTETGKVISVFRQEA